MRRTAASSIWREGAGGQARGLALAVEDNRVVAIERANRIAVGHCTLRHGPRRFTTLGGAPGLSGSVLKIWKINQLRSSIPKAAGGSPGGADQFV
jgi:hypothetical protein